MITLPDKNCHRVSIAFAWIDCVFRLETIIRVAFFPGIGQNNAVILN